MLSSTYQLNAYKALVAAGGLATPDSATSATAAANLAASLGDRFAGEILSTVTYPSTVTGYTSQISSWAETLSNAAEDANTYAAMITEYADPSVLIQLTNGWDIYCRANNLAASELVISAAIGDSSEPAALLAALQAISSDAVVAAMDSINTTLSAAAPATSDTSGTATATTPTLTDDQVAALGDAVTACVSLMADVTTKVSTMETRRTAAQDSATAAEDAFNKAIAVALISSSVSSPAVGSAVSAITPASVLALLEKGSS